MVKSTVFSTSTKKLAQAGMQTDFEELDLQMPVPLTANVEHHQSPVTATAEAGGVDRGGPPHTTTSDNRMLLKKQEVLGSNNSV